MDVNKQRRRGRKVDCKEKSKKPESQGTTGTSDTSPELQQQLRQHLLLQYLYWKKKLFLKSQLILQWLQQQ
jgi:hypothetical protein